MKRVDDLATACSKEGGVTNHTADSPENARFGYLHLKRSPVICEGIVSIEMGGPIRTFFFPPVLTLLLPSPALGQDGSEGATQRTVESAQQFLSELQQSNSAYLRYSIGIHLTMSQDARGRWRNPAQSGTRIIPEDYFEHWASWVVDRFEPMERCVTRVHFRDGSQVALQGSGGPGPQIIPPQKFVDIDWSRVEAVSGNWVSNFQPGFGFKLTLPPSGPILNSRWVDVVFGTQDTQAFQRALFAAQFLQENCKPKSETGF